MFPFKLATSLVKTVLFLTLVSCSVLLNAQVDLCPVTPTGTVTVGQQISVPIIATDLTDVTGLQGKLIYNTNNLQLVSATSVEADLSLNPVGGGVGEINFVFLDSSPDLSGITYPTGTELITITFDVIVEHDDPELLLDGNHPVLPYEVVGLQGAVLQRSICGEVLGNTGGNGNIETRLEVCIRQLNDAALSGADISFPLWISDALNLISFSFEVQYDPTQYQFNNLLPLADIGPITVDDSTPGLVVLGWNDNPAITSAFVELGSLEFTTLADIETPTVEINQLPGSSAFAFQNGTEGEVEACINTAFDPNGIVDFCAQVPLGSFAADTEVTIPVFVSNFNGVGWISLPFGFDNTQLEVLEIDAINTNNNFGFTWETIEEGINILGLEWTGTGYSLPDGAQLFNINCLVLQDVDSIDFDIRSEGNNFFVANDFEQSLLGEASYCNQFYVGNLPANVISSIYLDENNNCAVIPNQTALIDWMVTYVNDDTGDTYSATTGINGNAYLSLPVGNYTYSWSAPSINPIWDICPGGSLSVTDIEIVQYIESSTNVLSECSQLAVSISSFNLRPCFDNNRFRLYYSNYGSAPAEDAYIDVFFDPAFTPTQANTPFTVLGGGTYRFDLGDIPVNAYGSITITGMVDCNFPVSAAICAEATIYPFRTQCTPVNSNFLGGDVQVTSTCDGDSVRFRIENIGDGPTGIINFTVIEDVIIYMSQPVNIPTGDFMDLSVPATGGTYRLEAERPAFAPYLSQGLAIQEGCGTLPGGGISTGFVTGFPLLDDDLYFDRYCLETSAAYDPNDKQAIPAGVGASNFIEPNQRMDYKIRFQNTGTDTAFNIVIIDTLDTDVLDLSTLRPGISSHDYFVQMSGNEVSFIFDNIQLVDSFTNEPLSNGFVHFSIEQLPDLTDGTVLANRAGIYFDFNEPIITNYSRQTIGREILVSKVTSYTNAATNIRAYPSPTTNLLYFDLDEINGPVQVMIFDMLGRTLIQQPLIGNQPSLNLTSLPAGRYGYQLIQAGQLLQTGVISKN